MSRPISVIRQLDSLGGALAKFNIACKLSLKRFSQNTRKESRPVSKGGYCYRRATVSHELQLQYNTVYGQGYGTLVSLCIVSMANVTLVWRDSYMAHVISGLKQDTLAALCQASLDLPTLLPDSALKKAEEDISKFEDKGCTHTQSAGCKDSWYHSYRRSDKQTQEQRSGKLLERLKDTWAKRKMVVSPTSSHHLWPRVGCHINDNYFVNAPSTRLLTWSKEPVKFVNLCQLHRTGPDNLQNQETLTLYQSQWDQCLERL